MRTLAVLHVHMGRRDGGAERETAALVAGLTKSGHRVLALVRRGTPMERRALRAGAPIFPLGPFFPLGPSGLLTWWSRSRGRVIAAKGEWDLIHFHDAGSYARTVGLLTGASPNGSFPPSRLLVTYRGLRSGRKAPPFARLASHQRAGGNIAAASEALWAALVREGFDEDRLAVIHPGIDVKAFAADAAVRGDARRELGFDEGAEVVGTVAVLDGDRGVGEIIEAAALLTHDRPAARFVVVGEGPRRVALQRLAVRAGMADRVIFTGWREDVPRVLQAFDAYVFAGRGGEVFPASLIEAMAAGLPAVVSDQPGIREIIENGKQGLVVPERGAAALARTIRRVLSDRAAFRQMGRAGSVRVQRFHTQAMVDATEALYYRISKIAREA